MICYIAIEEKYFSSNLIKRNLASDQHSARHRFCNVVWSEILAGNSFFVRCHVTSKRERALLGEKFELYNKMEHRFQLTIREFGVDRTGL